MRKEISGQMNTIAELCKRSGVKELLLFGSASDDNVHEVNDFDFSVLFLSELDPLERGEAFLSLKHSLENLFGKKVDLVSYDRIKNPVFKESVDQSKKVIYAA